MEDKPGLLSFTCLAGFPVRNIDIYRITRFRKETAVTPRDREKKIRKKLEDKSNYPTLGGPSASAAF